MIGIFDSGVGGMTVARAIEQVMPDKRLIYYGDLARTPYGSKSPETIRKYALANASFLVDKGATLIVVACNSAASVAVDDLRLKFPQTLFEVISPATVRAAEISRSGRIGVIGTRATVRSNIYRQKIEQKRSGCHILSVACPLLVPLVEEGWLHKRETKMIIRRYLSSLKMANIDTLVLGCTHYPLLKDLIQARIGRRVRIIDSSVEVARHLNNFLTDNPDLSASLATSGQNRFYVSDVTDPARSTAARIFGRQIDLIRGDNGVC